MNKNYNSLKFVKFPSSGGIFPDILFECNRLNNNEKIKMSEIEFWEINKKITSPSNWINFQVQEEYFLIVCLNVTA